MIKKILSIFILSIACVINIYSQENFMVILDSFNVKDKQISIEINTDTTISNFDMLDKKQSFMYGKNNKMLYLDSYGDFSLFGSFPNSYIIGSLDTGLWIPVHYFYLFDHVNKKCFSLTINIPIKFNSFNGKDLSINYNLRLSNAYINFIVELDKNFTAVSSLTLVSLVADIKTKQKKGDIVVRAFYLQDAGVWYKHKVTYLPPYIKITDLSYTEFLNLIAKKIECNEVSETLICDSENCREALRFLTKSE